MHMWGTVSDIAFLIFLIIAFGGGTAYLKHRRDMKELNIKHATAKAEEYREKRLLLEAEKHVVVPTQ